MDSATAEARLACQGVTPPLPWLSPKNSCKATAKQSGLIKLVPCSEDSKSSTTLPNTVQSSQLKALRNAGTVSSTAEFHTLSNYSKTLIPNETSCPCYASFLTYLLRINRLVNISSAEELRRKRLGRQIRKTSLVTGGAMMKKAEP